MPNFLLASTYNGFYNTLNAIRAKHGVGGIGYTPAYARTPATSGQMSALQNSINYVKNNTDAHLSGAAIGTTVPNIGKGQTILWSTKITIDNILNAMYNVCHYYGAHYTNCNSDDSERYSDDWYDSGDTSDLSGWHDCGGDHSGCDALSYSDR